MFLDHIGGDASELKFDAIDFNKIQGNFTTIALTPDTGFWKIPIQSLYVHILGNTTFVPLDTGHNNRQAIVDTGTTVILAPKRIAKAIHALIPGARSSGLFSSSFIFPCQHASSFS